VPCNAAEDVFSTKIDGCEGGGRAETQPMGTRGRDDVHIYFTTGPRDRPAGPLGGPVAGIGGGGGGEDPKTVDATFGEERERMQRWDGRSMRLGKNGGPRSRTREKQQRENDKCGDSYNAGSSGGRVGQRQCEPSDRDRGLDHPDREEIRHTAEGGAYIVQPGKGGRTAPVPLTGNGCEAGTRYLLEDGGRKARWGGRESRRKKGSGILENNTIRGVYSDWREPLIDWVRGPGAPTGWGSAAG
jgi:hypothetical protein